MFLATFTPISKHVGHSSSVCYAVGKTERPAKRNYNNATPQRANQGVKGSAEKHATTSATSNDNNEWRRQRRHKGKGVSPRSRPEGEQRFEPVWEGPDIVGATHDTGEGEDEPQIPRIDQRGAWNHDGSPRRSLPGSRGGARGGSSGGLRHSQHKDGWGGFDPSRSVMSTNKYYSLMANGEFDVDGCGEEAEGCGEEEVAAMDIQPQLEHAENSVLHIDAGEHTREEDRQIVLVQGGPSYLPGTNLPC